jgi:hypothetical protein
MSKIDDWRAAVGKRDKVKALKDFLAVAGNEVKLTSLALRTRSIGGSWEPVDSDANAVVFASIESDIAAVINVALQNARADLTAAANAARSEAEAVLRDAT